MEANREELNGLKTKTFGHFMTGGKGWIDELPVDSMLTPHPAEHGKGKK
jgi:hypothetical protein